MKNFLFSLLLISVLYSCNQGPEVIEIKGFALPEGACSDGNFVYISNVGKEFKPLDKDGDGFISKLSVSGEVVEMNYIPKGDTLHSPKGMAVLNNILYVTDIDVLKGYDLNTGKKVFSVDFSGEGTNLLNDLTVKGNNTLLMSAMDINKIYEVRIQEKSFKVVAEMVKPNGLYWEEKAKVLIVGQFGRENNENGNKGDISTVKFEYETTNVGEFSSHQGNIDGVWKTGNQLIFTDWLSYGEKGGLKIMDISTKKINTLWEKKFDGPADFFYDEKTKVVWLPAMKENVVYRVGGLMKE